MMSDGEEAAEHPEPAHALHPSSASGPHLGGARPISSAAARFSKYLRTARRRRRAREDAGGYDATNPPLPLALHTALREGEVE